MIGRGVRGFKEGEYFVFGKGFGEDLPGAGRFDVEGGVVSEALVEERPLIEATETGELAGDGAVGAVVGAEMLHPAGDVCVSGGEEEVVVLAEVLGELFEVFAVAGAGEGAQAAFDAQGEKEITDQGEVA